MLEFTESPARSSSYALSGSHRRAVHYRTCVFLPRPILALCAQSSPDPVSHFDEQLKMQVDFNVKDPTSDRPGPKFSIDHLRVLIILLALPNNPRGSTLVSRSNFAAIFRSGVPDTPTKQLVSRLLGDLHNTWCRRILHLPNGESEELHFKILEAFNIRTRKQGIKVLWRQWEALRINPHFQSLVDGMARSGKGKAIPVFLPGFLALGSDLAAKIYLYLAAPAFHKKSPQSAFRVTTGALWERLGLPQARFLSVRKKLLTQNTHSVLNQVDNALISRGQHRLKVQLEPTADGRDLNLVVWSEPSSSEADSLIPTQSFSKFREAWARSGRSLADYRRAVSPPAVLDERDLETLTSGGIDPKQYLMAFRIAKSLLPNHKWEELLGEAKNDNLEKHFRPINERTRNPGGLLMYRLLEAVGTPVNRELFADSAE